MHIIIHRKGIQMVIFPFRKGNKLRVIIRKFSKGMEKIGRGIERETLIFLVLKPIANLMHSCSADLNYCYDMHWSGIKTGSIEYYFETRNSIVENSHYTKTNMSSWQALLSGFSSLSPLFSTFRRPITCTPAYGTLPQVNISHTVTP